MIFSDLGYIKNDLLLVFERHHMLSHHQFRNKTFYAKHCDSEPAVYQTKNSKEDTTTGLRKSYFQTVGNCKHLVDI